uniref:Calpain catalytic domain-containing protein n=1 Tax=Ditylenchus dipsaci TaxID=166011 RepID=A0A915CYD2_9BILA
MSSNEDEDNQDYGDYEKEEEDNQDYEEEPVEEEEPAEDESQQDEESDEQEEEEQAEDNADQQEADSDQQQEQYTENSYDDQQEQYNPSAYQEGEPDEEVSTASHQQFDAGVQTFPALSFDSIVKGALDGFGGGSMGDIMGTLNKITGGQGGLTNLMASGGLEAVASGIIANAAHHFFGVNPETGRIIGAIAGNIIFNLGGRDNSLSNIGKIVLDNIISGKFNRKVDPFISPTLPSFNLDFHVERDRCLREKRLFEDPEFPAEDKSLYFKSAPKKHIEWKRPAEIVNEPQLIVSKQSRFDVVQGALGDCWLLAATANLTLRDELFYRVVPPDQSFTENYAGIFHFQFWRYGKWVDVVIDDRLPTHNEKAYAKLYGSYEALKGGSTAEALEDFSGGLIEYFDLHEAPREHLLALLVRGFQMGSLFGCSIDADSQVTEARLENGLVRGHAYSITALQTVEGPHGETVLLRIRNPWGNDQEWNGPWSDNSPEWTYVTDEQRRSMHVSFNADGEFWMCFDDFIREFQRMENCNLGPEVMNEIYQMTGVPEAPKSSWTNFVADGMWQAAAGTAGGCKNHIASFPNNPQFSTMLTVDGSACSVEHDGKVTVICAVLQKYRRELRVKGLDSLPIGQKSFICGSEGGNCQIPSAPGNYVIVPSTYEPNEEAEFLMRVFSSGQISAMELRVLYTGKPQAHPASHIKMESSSRNLLEAWRNE